MSPTPTASAHSEVATTLWSDRRLHRRYPIQLDVEYELLLGPHVKRKGLGRTLNISTYGVLVDLKDTVPTVKSIRLSIKWPFLLNGSIPMNLFMRGHVVRVNGNRVAVDVTKRNLYVRELASNRSGVPAQMVLIFDEGVLDSVVGSDGG